MSLSSKGRLLVYQASELVVMAVLNNTHNGLIPLIKNLKMEDSLIHTHNTEQYLARRWLP